MTSQSKTLVGVALVIVLVAGSATILLWKGKSAGTQSAPWPKPVPTAEQLARVNVGLPEAQVEAKSLIFCAMAQKKIPAAENWCETLNVNGRLWPVTPTNTVFALNKQMAGRVYSRAMSGDTVVFFEAATPGWNQVGGPELLPQNQSVAVAFLDGRAMVVPASGFGKLRWNP